MVDGRDDGGGGTIETLTAQLGRAKPEVLGAKDRRASFEGREKSCCVWVGGVGEEGVVLGT